VRHPAAQPPILLRRAQEVDDLAQLGLRVVDPGDVVERRADPLRIGPPRPGAAERAQTAEAAPGRRPPAEQDEQADEQKRRAEAEQQLDPKDVPELLASTWTPLDCRRLVSWASLQNDGTCVEKRVVGVACASPAG
jgi:hypothetical protein